MAHVLPRSRLADLVGAKVLICCLVFEQPSAHQIMYESIEFRSLGYWTTIVEITIYADIQTSHGLVIVKYLVLEIEARVELVENRWSDSLAAFRAGALRKTKDDGASPRATVGTSRLELSGHI